MIVIRVDASMTIGIGHLMRCMTIAEYFQSKKIMVLFLSKTRYLEELVNKRGFETIFLQPESSMEDELKMIERIRIEHEFKTILLDINNFHTFSNLDAYNDYLQHLKKLSFFLVSFEDPDHCVHSSDIIIIPYLNAEKLELHKREKSKYLLGSKYYILRTEFSKVKPVKIRKAIKNVLITMGGSDPNNITLTVLEALKDKDIKLNLVIIISDLFQESENKIHKVLSDYNGSYSIIKNVENMAQIMSNSDIAIINSGLTKYETVSVGLPSIVISNNEYHAELMKDFEEYVLHLGVANRIKRYQIAEAIGFLAKNYKKRKQMADSGKSIIDGHGIDRIFSEIPTQMISA